MKLLAKFVRFEAGNPVFHHKFIRAFYQAQTDDGLHIDLALVVPSEKYDIAEVIELELVDGVKRVETIDGETSADPQTDAESEAALNAGLAVADEMTNAAVDAANEIAEPKRKRK